MIIVLPSWKGAHVALFERTDTPATHDSNLTPAVAPMISPPDGLGASGMSNGAASAVFETLHPKTALGVSNGPSLNSRLPGSADDRFFVHLPVPAPVKTNGVYFPK